MKNKFLAIIPCLNEELGIVDTIKSIKQVIPSIDIWVIDNMSSDRTSELAISLGAKIIKCNQRGKGFALRRAFTLVDSKYKAIFVVDGDSTYSIDSLPKALELVTSDGFDMVIGQRFDSTSTQKNRMKKYRIGHKTGNRVLSFLFRVLFNVKISDVFSGWRVFSPGFIKSFMEGNSGFEIEAELNTHAFVLSAAVTQIDVEYSGRKIGSMSKLRTYSDGSKIVRKQLKLFRNEKPLLAFSILAAPWLIISGLLFNRVLNEYLATGLVPKFPSLIAATGLFILAGLLWIAGIILERVRLLRVYQTRAIYSQYSRIIDH
jgi:glycosyltransferase involved in cell wall biosynthesis